MVGRVRRNVWGMQPDDPAITWYRKAVAWLIKRPAEETRSWRHLAFVHGVPANVRTPPNRTRFWEQCNHQNWFFLPWHRCYLASFEAVVAGVVEKELSGPGDWALPYWDYTEDLKRNPQARLMPPAFAERIFNGEENALFSYRKAATGGDFGIGDRIVSLAALTHAQFTVPGAGTTEGFGGPDSMMNPGAGNGAIESLPHNAIHVAIGGQDGFMGDPATAALDPIFWLHHANIDRLWERWRSSPGVSGSPDEDRWRDASFPFHDGDGNELQLTPTDTLDTATLMHGYSYDDTPVAAEPKAQPAVQSAAAAGPAFLAAANDGPLDLGDETVTTVGFLGGPAPMATAGTGSRRAFLNLENVTGTGVPGDFDVLVRHAGTADEPDYVGRLTTFGLDRASDPDLAHGGGGLNQAFDVTDLAERLGMDESNVDEFDVVFRRDAPGPPGDVPEALADYATTGRKPSSVRVGRVSLFYV